MLIVYFRGRAAPTAVGAALPRNRSPNWALAEWQRQYEACKADASLPKPSQMSLRRQLNGIKAERFPWMLEVTKNAPQMAIIQLGAAFKNFFAGRAKYPSSEKRASMTASA